MVWEAMLLFDIKYVSTYEPTVTYISTRISALGNTPALIHFLLHLVRHINQPKPIKHPVDVCHAPNITQRFRTVNYCSDLFYIAQRQQHRAPRQTFAFFSSVNPELFCVSSCQRFALPVSDTLSITSAEPTSSSFSAC